MLFKLHILHILRTHQKIIPRNPKLSENDKNFSSLKVAIFRNTDFSECSLNVKKLSKF